MKLIDLPRYHVFQFEGEKNIHLLNENYQNALTGACQFEWHRIYKDGRTNLNGTFANSPEWLASQEVTDLGDFYDWMKQNHPRRYVKEDWEASRPKKEDKT